MHSSIRPLYLFYFFFFLMIRRPPRSTLDRSSAASDVYKRQLGIEFNVNENLFAMKIGQHFVDIFNAFDIKVPDFEKFISIYKINYFEQMEFSKVYDGVEVTLSLIHISEPTRPY